MYLLSQGRPLYTLKEKEGELHAYQQATCLQSLPFVFSEKQPRQYFRFYGFR